MWLPRANHGQKQDPPLDQLVDHPRPMTEGLQLATARQAVFMQSPQPLGVTDVGLAAGDMLGVSRVDQHDFKSALLEELVDRDPVDPSGLHGDRAHAASLEPVRQVLQITSEGPEAAHRLSIAIRSAPQPCASWRRCRSPPHLDG